MNDMKFCPTCQSQLEMDAKFCTSCGSSQFSHENTVEMQEMSSNAPTPSPSLKKKKNKLIPVGLATGFLLSALLVAVLYEKKEDTTDEIHEISPPSPTKVQQTPQEENEDPQVEEAPPEPEFLPEPEVEPKKGVNMEGIQRKQLLVSHATASSTFPNWEHKSYGAENTLDGDTDTAWVENAAGIGVGEWLEHHFDSPQVVQEIQFYNGYGGVFEKNGVSSQVAVSLSEGETFLYQVEGHWNTLILPYALESTSVRITILEAYSPGDQDTCISEMLLFNKSEEAPTNQIENTEIAVLGDISTMSSEHIIAMLNKIQAFEEQKSSNYQDMHFSPSHTNAIIFDGGDGVPVLFLLNEYEDELLWLTTEMWEWTGSNLVEVTLTSDLVIVDENQEYVGFNGAYLSELLEKDGKYYIQTMHNFTGDAYGIYPKLVFSFENGRISQLVSGEISLHYYTEEEVLKVVNLMKNNKFYQKMLPKNFESDFLACVDEYGAYHYDFSFGESFSFNTLASNSRNDWFAEYSGAWTHSTTLKAWLQGELHK